VKEKDRDYSNHPDRDQIKKIITLVGLPRSGTTVLTAYFDAYPEICSVFEPWNANQKIQPEIYLDLEGFISTFTPDIGNASILFIKETSTKIQYLESIDFLLESIGNGKDKLVLILLRNPFHIFLSEFQGRKEWWGSPGLSMSLQLFEEWSRKSIQQLLHIFKIANNHKSFLVIYDKIVEQPSQLSPLMSEILPDTELVNEKEFFLRINPKKVRGDVGFSNNPRGFDTSSLIKREEELREISPLIEKSRYWYIWQSYNSYLMSLNGLEMLREDITDKFCELLNINIGNDNAEKYFQLGREYEKKKKYPLAIQFYEKCVKHNPNKWQAFHRIGLVYKNYHQKGSWERAINAFAQAIKINPDFCDSYNRLGKCLIELKRYREAVEYLEKAVELKPDFSYAHYNLGQALLKTGNPDQAAQEYYISTLLNKDILRNYNYLDNSQRLLTNYSDVSLQTKPSSYIKATHYFTRCSLGNFWSTFHKSLVRQDFEMIRNDGFNTIILIVPWANFQPSFNPIKYNEFYLERLSYLINQAAESDLNVILRVGYLWERWEDDPDKTETFDRYQAILYDTTIQDSWINYNQKILNICKQFKNYQFSFLNWEDFYWPLLKNIGLNKNQKDKVELARKFGFQQYISKKFTPEKLVELYDVKVVSIDEIALPTPEEPLFLEYVSFFDEYILEQIISLTQIAFKNSNYKLHYEHRTDGDYYNDLGQKKRAYQHRRFKNSAQNNNVIFWHPPLENKTDISLKGALSKLKVDLSSYYQSTKSLPFLDQFNFYVNNPAFPKACQISELDTFVLESKDILKEFTIGYGIWGYFDWRNDKVFNGSFELDKTGWKVSSNVQFTQSKLGKHRAKLLKDSSISQELKVKGRKNWLVYLEVLVHEDSQINIAIDNTILVSIELKKSENMQRVNQSIFNNPSRFKDFKLICLKGEIELNQIAVYFHIYSNGFRTVYGETRPLLKQIQKLNYLL
jgi:tetratricopeptide (TPR) repeat protein